MGLCAVSVDLDSLVHYCRIHGLSEGLLDDRARELVYQVAVPRFRALFEELGIPGTFFAIGEDLDSEVARTALKDAHASGIEIGNHSYSHDYALSRRAPEELRADLQRGADAIAAAIGVRPTGFRAPGYTLSPALYQAVIATGHSYDSSAFPATPYYLGKAAVMGGLWLSRRPSRAVLDSPSVLRAPRDPYRPDPQAPYRRGEGAALELPITTVPVTGFPFIGTFAVTLPRPVIHAAYRLLRTAPLFNFELHAVDLLDEADGIPRALARRQRDLRVPYALKSARLRELLRRLRDDFEVTTLANAARILSAGGGAVV